MTPLSMNKEKVKDTNIQFDGASNKFIINVLWECSNVQIMFPLISHPNGNPMHDETGNNFLSSWLPIVLFQNHFEMHNKRGRAGRRAWH